MVLVTRVRCHLCQQARAIVSRVAAELALAYREVDVDADPAWPPESAIGSRSSWWTAPSTPSGMLTRTACAAPSRAGAAGCDRDDGPQPKAAGSNHSREQQGQA